MSRRTFSWRSAGSTDVGRVREVNEDTYLDAPDVGLWVVADGMGGHAAGDVASGLIVRALKDVVLHDDGDAFIDDVERRLTEVNRLLYERSVTLERTMGSTVVAVLAHRTSFVVLWAGDSRVYRRSSKGFQQITRDHSQVEELVALGEITRDDARDHPLANVITRAVGGARKLRLEACMEPLQDGDRLLICSDGLFKDLDDDDLNRLLAEGNARESCGLLIDAALDRGGGDNITAIVVDFRSGA
ncbi:MAG: protein phosphatase 2C domain-containing protein [Pseudomonadota bacterium]